MTIKERINADFMEAYKAKNMKKKDFLGVVKGEIQNEEGRTGTLSDTSVLAVLKKIEKSLKQTNTPESLVELEFLEPYLPTLMSEETIREKVRLIIIESGNKNVGYLMGMFNKQNTGASFDNKVVSTVIKEEIA